MEQVLNQQLKIISWQLEILGRTGQIPLSAQPAPLAGPGVPEQAAAWPEPAEAPTKAFGAGARIKTIKQVLTPAQQEAIQEFARKYNAKTKSSKEFTQHNRGILADPRAVSGFNPVYKEVVYPIVMERSAGSRMWDLDNNEYIDSIMGFGANLFGHSPSFITEAIREQLDKGMEIGPQLTLAAQAAELMVELTGQDRAAFCNTGSEAVLGAMRLARTVTGRDTIAVFKNSYHGIFDEVVSRGTRKLTTIPAAPGIPRDSVKNLLILDYGAPESLEILRSRSHELAAIMVEPVQSRALDLQPREFLQALKPITESSGAALIFDEVITGFRSHPGGAQAVFGVKADLATYGKIMGGGMPIGGITGCPRFMDALDGGEWRFGDDSFPQVGVTYFAGTFVRHPLTMAAARASLTYLKEAGPKLQENLNQRTADCVAEIRAFLEEYGAPLEIKHFSSLFRIAFKADLPLGELIYPWLRFKNIHIFQDRSFFLTTAHSDQDIEALVQAIKETVVEMTEAGLLGTRFRNRSCAGGDTGGTLGDQEAGGDSPRRRPARARGQAGPGPGRTARLVCARSGTGREIPVDPGREVEPVTPPLPQAPKMGPVEFDPFAEGELSLTIPLTEPQKEIWTSAQMGREANCSYNESVSLVLKGPLKEEALREAFRQAAGRHEALRMTFSPEGDWVCVVPRLDLEVPLVDLAGLNPEERDRDLAGLLAKEVETPFDLVRGPLLRARIVRLESELHQVLITAHHIVCDGWSIDVLVADLARIYSVLAKGEEPDLEPADLFSDYVSTLALPDRVRAVHEDRNYWLSQYAVQPPVTDLPTDRPRPPLRTYQAGRLDWEVPGELVKSLKNLGTKTGCTFLNVLMAGFAAFIHRLSGQDDIVIGLPAAGQSIEGRETLVGHCVHLLPLRFRLDKDITFREYLAKVRSIVLDSHEHQRVTLGDLIPRMKLARDPSRIPLAPVSFNLDQGIDLAGMSFIGLESEFFSNHRKYDNFEFQINVSPFPDRIVFECMYNSGLWDRETVSQRLEELGVLFRALTEDPDQKVVQAPLLSNREKESILALGTGERIDPLPGRTVVELIEEQAASTPESQAVFHQGGGLTYAQLNRKANALAGFLQQRGVGPGTLVGLCLKRSPAMIVGLAGILKAGGAYLPLDPDNPAQRLARILENSGLKLILTDEATGGRIAPKVGPGVGLESGWAGLDDEQAENPVRRAGLDDPAYVIYTSGSTGVPKGAVIAHRSLAAYVQSLDAVYGVGSGDRLLQFSTLWFDASVHDIFITLCRGACLVLRDEETLGSARLFFPVLPGKQSLPVHTAHGLLQSPGRRYGGSKDPNRTQARFLRRGKRSAPRPRPPGGASCIRIPG